MRLDENVYSLHKGVSFQIKKKPKNISFSSLNLFHKIFDTLNISFLILIFILSFLSFNSQRKWSITYDVLSKTKVKNNNLIDYISKLEEKYISELESEISLKKTKPKDLIYLKKIKEKKENSLNKKIKKILSGIHESKFQRGF